MGKSEEERMAALIRKTVAKAAKKKKTKRRNYDGTLPQESDENDMERQAFFSEMKKREF